jgi:hypothetical protein
LPKAEPAGCGAADYALGYPETKNSFEIKSAFKTRRVLSGFMNPGNDR